MHALTTVAQRWPDKIGGSDYDDWVFTSARRYKTMGRGKVFGLYVRNFCAEIFFHRPSDTTHEDVRA